MKKLLLIISIIIIFIVISVVIILNVFNNSDKETSPNQFAVENNNVSLDDNTNKPPLVLNEANIKIVLKEYLPKILNPEFGGVVFCGNHLYGYKEEPDINNISIFVWAYCEEYYLDDTNLMMGSGISEPMKLTIKNNNNNLEVVNHFVPKDGSLYNSSIGEMFPGEYQKEALAGFDVSLLFPSPKDQARQYFSI